MLAISFSSMLFLYWILLGFSLQSFFKTNTSFHCRFLISPALGLAACIIALFLLSRLGFSIREVAIPLFSISMVLIIYASFIAKRVILKFSTIHLMLFLIFVSVLPFAWVFIKFGFEWLAYANGDMSFYSLSASRFLEYGYSELPVSGNLLDTRDHSLAYWSFPNEMGHRMGAELLLAQVIAVSGLNAHQVFMPLIVACHACVIASAGALTLLGAHKRSSALWAMLLVALSPMLTLEVTLQLLAQAIGLAFLTGLCVAYVYSDFIQKTQVWNSILIVLISSLSISYSEILPFFVLFVIIYEAFNWRIWLNRINRIHRVRKIMLITVGVVCLLNTYSIDVIHFVFFAMHGSFESTAMAMQSDGLSLFPSFFLPSSSALLWGWIPFNLTGEPNSISVVFGILAMAIFFIPLVMVSHRGIPSVLMVLVMLAVAAYMYVGTNGFGVFKLAMFIQPFFLSTVVILISMYLSRRIVQYIVLVLFGSSILSTQYQNISEKAEALGARFPYASTSQVGSQLRKISSFTKSLSYRTHVYSDTYIRELFLFESYYFKGTPFVSLVFPMNLRTAQTEKSHTQNLVNESYMKDKTTEMLSFDFNDIGHDRYATFIKNLTIYQDSYLLAASKEFSPVNKSNSPIGRNFYIQRVNQFNNHLLFQNSSLGTSYIGDNWMQGGVAIWDLEKDLMFKASYMAAVNRYHIYQVLNPIENSRFLLSMSSSVNVKDDFMLPKVKVIGKNNQYLPIVGRGSARIISASIFPKNISNENYLGLDFGRDGSFQKVKTSGAMTWFGKDIKRDIRKYVGFARNISYISPSQYTAIKRPYKLNNFPSDLADPNLEYSGIFEDGWISNIAYVIFKNPVEDNDIITLKFSGMIPEIKNPSFVTILKVKVNGQVVYDVKQMLGRFNLSIPVPNKYFEAKEKTIVQIESSQVQRLPNGDGRPVSVHIEYLGF